MGDLADLQIELKSLLPTHILSIKHSTDFGTQRQLRSQFSLPQSHDAQMEMSEEFVETEKINLPNIWQMLANNMKAFKQCVSENTIPDIRDRCDKADISFIARESRCSSSIPQALAWKSESLAYSPAFVTDLPGDLGCIFLSL